MRCRRLFLCVTGRCEHVVLTVRCYPCVHVVWKEQIDMTVSAMNTLPHMQDFVQEFEFMQHKLPVLQEVLAMCSCKPS